MDTDVSMDELEKKELELLRNFASACKQNEFGEAENEVKRQCCDPRKYPSDLGFKTSEIEHGCNGHVWNTVGRLGLLEEIQILCLWCHGAWLGFPRKTPNFL